MEKPPHIKHTAFAVANAVDQVIGADAASYIELDKDRVRQIDEAIDVYSKTKVMPPSDITREEFEARRFSLKNEIEIHQLDKNRKALLLHQIKALQAISNDVPHPVWMSRFPPELRKYSIEEFKNKERMKPFLEVCEFHEKHNNPIFTISQELTEIIKKCDLDESLPCEYVRSPTPTGCYFNLPYFKIMEDAIQSGFYLQPGEAGINVVIVNTTDMCYTFCIPSSRMSVKEWFDSQPVLDPIREKFAFIVMLLFYCNSAQFRLDNRPEYSEVVKAAMLKKNPSKRRDALRKASKKYDYILIRPSQEHSISMGTGGERSPHFRRGHFRLQHFGPRNSMERMIFIEPCFVKGKAKIKDYIVD